MDIKSRILAADDLISETVTIPEWDNVKVRVRSLTGGEVADLVKNSGVGKTLDPGSYSELLLAAALRDPETNERIFTDDEASELSKKSAAVFMRLVEIAQGLNEVSNFNIAEGKADSEANQ
jgi:hypothetical protein